MYDFIHRKLFLSEADQNRKKYENSFLKSSWCSSVSPEIPSQVPVTIKSGWLLKIPSRGGISWLKRTQRRWCELRPGAFMYWHSFGIGTPTVISLAFGDLVCILRGSEGSDQLSIQATSRWCSFTHDDTDELLHWLFAFDAAIGTAVSCREFARTVAANDDLGSQATVRCATKADDEVASSGCFDGCRVADPVTSLVSNERCGIDLEISFQSIEIAHSSPSPKPRHVKQNCCGPAGHAFSSVGRHYRPNISASTPSKLSPWGGADDCGCLSDKIPGQVGMG